MSRNAFYYITQANKSSPTNYNKMFDCLNISTNVGVLIPNPASVFVLDVRISRKIELKLAKKNSWRSWPANMVGPTIKLILMHVILRQTYILKHRS